MTAAARRALDRAPIVAKRGVMLAVPLLLAGVLVAAFALAPTPAGRTAGRPAASDGLLPPARAPGPSPAGASRADHPDHRAQRDGPSRTAHQRAQRTRR